MFYTKDDYFKYWFINGDLKTSYGRCTRPLLSFKEECIAAAKLIREQVSCDKDIVLLYSGGMDSEVMVESFHLAGIYPTILHYMLFYKEQLVSQMDDIHASYYSVNKNFEMKLYNIDLEIVLDTLYREQYHYIYREISPQLLIIIYMMRVIVTEMRGFPVVGSGDPTLYERIPDTIFSQSNKYPAGIWKNSIPKDILDKYLFDPDKSLDLWEREKCLSLYGFLKLNSFKGVPAFFQYTPELYLKYMLTLYSFIMKLRTDLNRYVNCSTEIKNYIYKPFNLNYRPKRTGWENVQTVDNKYRTLFSENNDANKISITPSSDVYRSMCYEEPNK